MDLEVVEGKEVRLVLVFKVIPRESGLEKLLMMDQIVYIPLAQRYQVPPHFAERPECVCQWNCITVAGMRGHR